MKTKAIKWTPIADVRVRHLWQCPYNDCGNILRVGPESYMQVGTPMCPDCDREMEYVRTEIKNES